jgi:murein DD-endopeptidase MepM/ murein hydrolase activator NlpD
MKILSKLLIILCFIVPTIPAVAQSTGNDTLIYIVQYGDTINSIAYRLGISPIDLADVNSIQDINQISEGERLVVPGLVGLHGILTTKIVPLGENLLNLTRQYRIPKDIFSTLNHITSPSELYAGASIFVTEQEENNSSILILEPGESTFETSVLSGISPWSFITENQLSGTWDAIPGEKLYFSSGKGIATNSDIMPSVVSIDINPLPLVQGKTITISIATKETMQLEGTLGNNQLHFIQVDDNKYIALQGINAMANVGLSPITIRCLLPNGEINELSQSVLLKSGYYPNDPPLQVDPATVDPAVTKPEDSIIAKITSPVSSEKLWTGKFKPPMDEPICINSWFGDRRSYNNSAYIYFHTGVDYGVCANLFIYAPAAGMVVYTGSLTVRGNATIIDHGWGVYSGFWHQKEIRVKVGDRVEPGQIIGLVGGTGRVNGPHLHWEIWVNGNQADPLDWLDNVYPVLK